MAYVQRLSKLDKEDPVDEDFKEEKLDFGDEFGAIKPWLGAIKEPTLEPLQVDTSMPDDTYEIDFAHGYKSDGAFQNLYYNANMKPCYATATLGIILDPVART